MIWSMSAIVVTAAMYHASTGVFFTKSDILRVFPPPMFGNEFL